jgi:REP element-mobilizing transposase RayT
MRNFVADHLKTRDEKDAALVAFVSPTEKQWRFSYVKMDYATVKKESGKIGVEERVTPARRFSYLVGEGESSHTAQSRFLSLLQNTQKEPTLADLEEAFSVEAVTKEFFKKYAELFEDIYKALDRLVSKDSAIKREFAEKGVNTVDFSKKLMGQIVFLYFLQKKGWLGVEKDKEWGTGPRDFLRRLANGQYGKYDNFFNDVLEPLFYDTLATDRGHEAWDKHFKCRIPFLNGGLFEPIGDYDWRRTDITLPNKLFTNNEFVEEGITGTGVLDVFDRYNFTVNEAEPLEKEVAIDPEMLGKVFENLIEENRRKGLGSYYTPREIVHYMCQESLINYLDTALNVEVSKEEQTSSSIKGTTPNAEHDQDGDATVFFDPFAPVEIRHRNLPHWTQAGVTYFVTFRLADSLPQEKLEQLRSEREHWLKTHQKPLSNSDKKEYRRLFAQKVEDWLDAGIGQCVLREPHAAKIVADALRHFDGKRYKLGEWVVMPNHVHVLVTPYEGFELVDILHSWKSFTANEINTLMKSSGRVWQHESYDHIVRSEEELARIEQYIIENPSKAGIVAPASSGFESRPGWSCHHHSSC